VKFAAKLTRNGLFTGKGGVGKTSIACATAISLADQGKRVLLVSTDPASNLDEVLETKLTTAPTQVFRTELLFAMNVDPEEAARQYRERVVGPYRELLPESAVENIEEQLSGACTVEIAAFDEFAKLLGDAHASTGFDHIIFDTAPTGHTLRLLQLPAAWSGFIESNIGGTSCLGPLAGLQAQRELYANTVKALSDPSLTTVFLVTRPERSSITEAERTRSELQDLGLANQSLIINGIFHTDSEHDPIATALHVRGNEALSDLPAGLAGLPRFEIPLVAGSLIGLDSLRGLTTSKDLPRASERQASRDSLPPLASLVHALSVNGHGVIMTMGKGGVGKTTVAAAVAVELARLGHDVHLTTTDPAAHIHLALEGDVPGLTVTRIDPVTETQAYAEEVLAEAGRDLDEKGRALLEEDLRSPCTEEIAVFRAFARRVDDGNQGFVVIDTAPTGHTLLLLDAAQAYHREVTRNLNHIPDTVSRLLPQLRNPEFTRILVVTLPEATPVHEASRLQDDLRRAGIEPYAWVINQSFRATNTADPLLLRRGELEERYIAEVRDELARHLALIPWQPEAPVGTARLRQLAEAVAQ
jgi:arsenite/tail-anchored protein-transporting ATPase